MERRLKRQREDTLDELRRNRTHGQVTRQEGESDDAYSECEESAPMGDKELAKDLEDFIADGPQELMRAHNFAPTVFALRADPIVPTSSVLTSVATEQDDFARELIDQLNGDEEEEGEAPAVAMSSKLAMQTSDFDRLKLTSMNSDSSAVFQLQQAATSEAMDMDWDDLPESLLTASAKAHPPPSSIFTTTHATVSNLLDKNGEISVFWFDALERPQSATLYLFGKVRNSDNLSFSSCCVAINNLDRTVYMLPKDGDVFAAAEEVRLACQRQGILPSALDRVTKAFPFAHRSGVALRPTEKREWLMLRYPFSQPVFKSEGISSVALTLGSAVGMFETLAVEQRLMGPGWIVLKPSLVAKKSVSWCRIELECAQPQSIHPMLTDNLPVPPLQVLSLRLLTQGATIVGIVGRHSTEHLDERSSRPDVTDSSFVVLRDPTDVGYSATFCSALQAGLTQQHCKLEIAKHERALLNYFIAVLQRFDPDVLVSHTLLGGEDISALVQRMRANKVDFWSRLGRLNWTQFPTNRYMERQVIGGRLPVDSSIVLRDLVRDKSYTLDSLSRTVLHQEPFMPSETTDPAQKVIGEMERLLWECQSQWEMVRCLNGLALTKQLTNLAGNLWSRTLQGLRAERNEYLLLHEFHDHGYLCPDPPSKIPKPDVQEDGDEEDGDEVGYAGGLVLEPVRGFYDKLILLLDFNSLYPSIIQEFGVCFLNEALSRGASELELIDAAQELLLPRVLSNLVTRRRQVKQLLKTAIRDDEKAMLNVRQQALKLTANSIYGCLGFPQSRFYAKHLAATITQHGRKILMDTRSVAESSLSLNVIYGDTDSLMIATQSEDRALALEKAEMLKRAINQKYRHLELDIDGIFAKLLLLRKKKYAALKIANFRDTTGAMDLRLETKGLDMVRRDWCPLVADVSEHVLDAIMHKPTADVASSILEYLGHVRASLPTLPMDRFIITKMLTKAPELYADPQNQPHVAVALRMNQGGGPFRFGAHDVVPYVIITAQPGSGGLLSERVCHPSELASSGTLDLEWYCAQQLFPTTTRLCEFVVNLSSGQIASAFGLDSKRYHTVEAGQTPQSSAAGSLVLRCGQCQQETTVVSANALHRPGSIHALPACAHCQSGLALSDVAKAVDSLWTVHHQSTQGAEERVALYVRLQPWLGLLDQLSQPAALIVQQEEAESPAAKKVKAESSSASSAAASRLAIILRKRLDEHLLAPKVLFSNVFSFYYPQ